MPRKRRIDIIKEIQRFKEMGDKFIIQLSSITRHSPKDSKAFAEIVGKGEVLAVVSFLNGICTHSHKRWRLLRHRLVDEGYKDVFNALVEAGLREPLDPRFVTTKKEDIMSAALRQIVRTVESLREIPDAEAIFKT